MTVYVVDSRARWIALVRGAAALMLPRTAEAASDLWEALAATDPVGSVLGRLTRDGLADVPPFAMVVGTDRRRVIVRGGFRVVASADEITASGVSTWVERIIPADAPYEVIAPFASVADDADELPILEGMVPASVVRSVPLSTASQPGAPAEVPAVVPAGVPAAGPAAGPKAPPAEPAPITAEASIVPEETMVPLDDDALADALANAVDDAVDDATIVVAKRTPAAAPASPTVTAATGDHDGLTIAVAALQELRGRAKRPASAEKSGTGTSAADTELPAGPPAVTLRLPGGADEPLTGEIVLGRSPSVSRATGTALPRLVTIGAGDPDISRSHVRIGLEGGTIVVTDLHSRNGTSVLQPGRAPVKLRAGEPTPVLVGTVVDLGGGCEVAVVTR